MLALLIGQETLLSLYSRTLIKRPPIKRPPLLGGQ